MIAQKRAFLAFPLLKSKISVGSASGKTRSCFQNRSFDVRETRLLFQNASFDVRETRLLFQNASFDARETRLLCQNATFHARKTRLLYQNRSLPRFRKAIAPLPSLCCGESKWERPPDPI